MKFKKILAVMLVLAMLVASVGCVPLDSNGNPISSSGSQTKTQSELFDDYMMDVFREIAGDNLLSSQFIMNDPSKFGLTDIPKTIGRIDFEEMDNIEKAWQEDYDELTAFDRSKLTDDQQQVYDLLIYEAELSKDAFGLQYHSEINSPLLGEQSGIPSNLSEYKITSVQGAYDYIEMLNNLPKTFEDYIVYQRRRSAMGLFMSDSMADKTIASCESFMKEPENNMLISSFEQRLDKVEGVSEEEKQKLTELNKKAVLESVIPAYKTFAEGIASLKGTGKNDGGVCNLPNGLEYFEFLIKNDTGTERSVPEIMELVENYLLNEILELGSIIRSNPKSVDAIFEYKDAETDPVVILENLLELTKEIVPPLSGLTYEVKYVDASMQEHSSPAFYYLPPVDSDGSNSIYVNEKYLDTYMTLYSLLGHEGYPGHMYQTNYFLQTAPSPLRYVLRYKGYSEGWATYMETLCFGMLGIEDPQIVRLMQINNDLSLLLSCFADLGVNYEGWDLATLTENLDMYGYGDAETAKNIFDAVVEEPGNYTSYCLGYLEFLELRAYAEEKLGESFDEMAFHKAILDVGSAPFKFVREAVEKYVGTVKLSKSVSSKPSIAA